MTNLGVGTIMRSVSLKDAKAGLSALVDGAIRGEFVAITRHGKPVAALVPLAAAEQARNAAVQGRPDLIAYLRTFPADVPERNPQGSRDVDL